ncbi:MAG: class I SAM-dependent methyltransferase [Phycisphaeraceae bacterium]|nr:class I SAM-dependent methyltransferase [Phycisphaeraceae bacterium]
MRNSGSEQHDPAAAAPTGPDWPAYFDAVAGLGPRETLLQALDRFDREGRGGLVGVDLGAGSGRDTIEMLRRGWMVTAVDSCEDGLRRLREGVPPEFLGRLWTVAERYETAAWPAADLINASFSIPHCEEGAFPGLWRRIVESLRPSGRFCGQLFGVRDGLAVGTTESTEPIGPSGWRGGRQFHTREQVEALLEGFDAEFLDEVERPGKNAFGEPKDWHVFHIVARKR